MLLLQDAPGEIKTFLKPLAQAAGFSQTARSYLVRLMIGFLFHFGRMSASRAAEAMPAQARHRGGVARFLAQCRWSRDWNQCLWMAGLLLEQERKRGGRWLLIFDQTYCSQQGDKTENTYSTGNRQRRPAKNRRYSKKKYVRRRVHGFVMGLLLTPSGMRLPMSRSYYTKDYCKAKGRPYRTQTEIAAAMIQEVSIPQHAEVVVLGDTAYEAASIRRACSERGFTWIMPLNPERVLAGPKGQRPKVRTLLDSLKPKQFVPVRFTPGKGAYAAHRRVSRYRIGPKAKRRTFYVHEERRAVHSLGMATLVFSTKEQPKDGQAVSVQKILVSNGRLRASEVVELYDLRWQIELFFKELKSTLGAHQYRFRRFEAVETWMQTTITTVLYLEWYRARQLRRRDLDEASQKWWRCQRTYGLARAIRQTAETTELSLLAERIKTPSGRRQVAKQLRAAQPLEYRRAG
jgi:Transposase DDE domain